MMKKLVLLGIVLAMVMGLAVTASAAYDPNWVVNINATANSDYSGGLTGAFATKAGFSDGLGPAIEDGTPAPATPEGTPFFGSKIDGVGGYLKDGRSSFVGNTIIWDLTLNKFGGATDGVAYVSIWNPADTKFVTTNDFTAFGKETIKLYQVVDGSRNLLWTADPNSNSVAQLGAFAIGSQFQLEASDIVPEPGSIVAMLSGLVGLAGFGIRRKK